MAKATKDKPWWLETGHDQCTACSHTYVYETGFYCAGCDGPVCGICVEETVSIVCVHCKSADQELSTGPVKASRQRRFRDAEL